MTGSIQGLTCSPGRLQKALISRLRCGRSRTLESQSSISNRFVPSYKKISPNIESQSVVNCPRVSNNRDSRQHLFSSSSHNGGFRHLRKHLPLRPFAPCVHPFHCPIHLPRRFPPLHHHRRPSNRQISPCEVLHSCSNWRLGGSRWVYNPVSEHRGSQEHPALRYFFVASRHCPRVGLREFVHAYWASNSRGYIRGRKTAADTWDIASMAAAGVRHV